MELVDILYVEDDPDIRALVTLTLETVGHYTVRTVNSGQEALAALESYPPQLILLDVMMPGMDGPGTLLAIRQLENGKNVPIIFITAKVQKQEQESYMALGAIGTISKPFDPMTLSATVRQLWEKSRANEYAA